MKQVSRLACLAPLCLLASTSCSSDNISKPPVEQARKLDSLRRDFQAELEREVARHNYPGATAAFALPDGRVEAFAAGHADRATGERMRPDHRMLSASIGKTFVAALALALAGEGKLDLDESVSRWLGQEPWFARLPNAPRLTLRSLLGHTSGIPNHAGVRAFQRDLRKIVAQDPVATLRPVENIRYVLDAAPLFPVGRGYAYSDTNYLIAGLALERAGGANFYDQVQRRFLDALGLSLTSPSDRPRLEGLANAYWDRGTNFLGIPTDHAVRDGALLYNPAIEWTGGGFVSNPRDLVTWARHLYEGRAMPTAYLDELFASTPTEDAPERYGLGVYIYRTPLGRFYGHGGAIPGYYSSLLYSPDDRAAVSVQVNGEISPHRTALALAKLLRDHLRQGSTAVP